MNGLDYCTSLFVSCRQPCHGEIHGVDYRTPLSVIDLTCSVGYEQRRETTKEERIVQIKTEGTVRRLSKEERLRSREKETLPPLHDSPWFKLLGGCTDTSPNNSSTITCSFITAWVGACMLASSGSLLDAVSIYLVITTNNSACAYIRFEVWCSRHFALGSPDIYFPCYSTVVSIDG